MDRCNELEDLTESEKKAEMLPMKVQHVYILTQMGKLEEAERVASTIPFTEQGFINLSK